MSDTCYTVRATTRSEVKKGIGRITPIKNDAGQYSHNDIRTAIKEIHRVVKEQFNPSSSCPDMAKLLEDTPNALTNKKALSS